jgi:signal transduction histidine kinase
VRGWLAGPTVRTGPYELACITASAAAILMLAQLDEPGSAGELLVLSPALVAFVLRGMVSRLYPELFAVAVIPPIAAVVGHAGHLEGTFFLPTLVTLYTAWHLGVSVRSSVILAAAAVTPWLVTQHLLPHDQIGWQAWSSATVFTFGLGMGLRKQQMVIEELREAREALAEQAVAEERRRIARELHDLAGHTLAAVLLHVTGARHVLRRDIDEAERALLDAETVGRASLDQIRATVAALRTDERGTDPSLAGSADLTDLVDEYRRAGLVVALTLSPRASGLTGPLGTAVHRIARESLANVARHAPANHVLVEVDHDSRAVRLSVTDHGRPAAPADRGAGHFGLVGMQERTRALGGMLEAGPTPDGWAVVARLPLTVAAPDEVLRP